MSALLALALGGNLAGQDPPDPARIREARDRILADGRFHRGERRPTWAELLGKWLKELLRRFLGGFGVEPGSAAWWLILVGGLVLLGAILTHVGFVIYRGIRAARRGAEEPGRSAPPETADPDDALRRAREAAARSAWAEAFSWTYRAALLALRRRDLLVLRDGATAREFLRQLAAGVEARPGFERLVSEYETVVFGHRSPAPGSAERHIAEVEAWSSQAAWSSHA